jgi:hypothetical protein
MNSRPVVNGRGDEPVRAVLLSLQNLVGPLDERQRQVVLFHHPQRDRDAGNPGTDDQSGISLHDCATIHGQIHKKAGAHNLIADAAGKNLAAQIEKRRHDLEGRQKWIE